MLTLPARLLYPFGFVEGEPGLAALCKPLLTFQWVGFLFYTHKCYGSSKHLHHNELHCHLKELGRSYLLLKPMVACR